MSVTYVGRELPFKGKKLFHLLGNLKDFGVGRMVFRHMFNERYPEPSYYIITRVQPDMSRLDDGIGIAWGYKVFRGEKLGERPIKACYKADWRLVPRTEEEKFSSYSGPERPCSVIPSEMRMPPLMELLIKQKREAKGEKVDSPIMLKRTINSSAFNRAVLDTEEKILQENLQ